MSVKSYTKGEEIANSTTHGLGIIFGIIAGGILLELAIESHNSWAVSSVLIYIISMVLSYTTSTLYHSCSNSERKSVFRKCDHAAIYVHIAGTYTPITLIVLREDGAWGWSLFIIAWIAAIVGSILSFTKQKAGSKLETICYVAMGLVICVAFKPLVEILSSTGSLNVIYFLIAGGVSYILGAVLYSIKKKYMHSVFHLFVLGGSVCHVLAIMNIFTSIP